MNRDAFNDSELKGFEARLATLAPQLSHVEQQQLLYECAFAAGQHKARRAVRRWQTATVSMGLLLLGAVVPIAQDQWRIEPPPGALVVVQQGLSPKLPEASDSAVMPIRPVTADLDAWQLPNLPGVLLNQQMAQLEQSDLHTQSLAVGRLTQTLLTQ